MKKGQASTPVPFYIGANLINTYAAASWIMASAAQNALRS